MWGQAWLAPRTAILCQSWCKQVRSCDITERPLFQTAVLMQILEWIRGEVRCACTDMLPPESCGFKLTRGELTIAQCSLDMMKCVALSGDISWQVFKWLSDILPNPLFLSSPPVCLRSAWMDHRSAGRHLWPVSLWIASWKCICLTRRNYWENKFRRGCLTEQLEIDFEICRYFPGLGSRRQRFIIQWFYLPAWSHLSVETPADCDQKLSYSCWVLRAPL